MKSNILLLVFCCSLVVCKSQTKCDNEIVLINIDTLSRDKIALVVSKLDSLSPRVLGLDVLFLHRTNYDVDLQLVTSLHRANNLVMARIIDNYPNQDISYTYKSSAPEFLPDRAKYGFINTILAKNETRTISSFSVLEMVNDDLEYQFSVMVALLVDSSKTQRFIRENKNIVNINFTDCKFKVHQSDQILRGQISEKDIRNKIVLLGFLGPGNEDKFFLYSKEGRKEVYGVEYLACIIEQILR